MTDPADNASVRISDLGLCAVLSRPHSNGTGAESGAGDTAGGDLPQNRRRSSYTDLGAMEVRPPPGISPCLRLFVNVRVCVC